MKPLTPKTCSTIVYGHNCGQSSPFRPVCIIAKQLECGKTTVNDILKHFHETHFLTPKTQTGRPPLLNSPAQQELKEFVQENEQPVSAITIRRNLKKVGLTACIPCKKPALSEAHCQARLEWAHAHENWSARKWRQDNASPYHSKVATAACKNAGIVVLDWPAQSPDLNPIENL
ncbi:transposable element Tc1 transposase [Rhizophagus irregularis DAOM 181602=DAOM 197198]|nr:transposable element Tc1 transposase [Rhizophagus irregularis DAOM 181602=DAOM 197198]